MRPGNSDVKTPSLHACALVLHNADAHALYVQNRPIGEKCLVCRHRHVRLDRLPAGRDSCSRSTLMRKIFCAVCSAVKFTRVFELDFTVEYSIHLAKQFVEQIISL